MKIVYILDKCTKESQAYKGNLIEKNDTYIIEAENVDILLKDFKKINLIKYYYGMMIEMEMEEKIYICVPLLFLNIGTGILLVNSTETMKLFNKFKEKAFYKKMSNNIIYKS